MRTQASRRFRRLIRPIAAVALAGAAAAALAGCAAENSPLRGVARVVDFATDAPQPAPFVAESRRADTGYMRIERELPARPSGPRTPEEVKALEAELDAARQRTAAEGAAAQAEAQAQPPIQRATSPAAQPAGRAKPPAR
ncbi:hypothetical protein ACFFJB_08845 [Camelimonas abortus]|uniref:Beta-barrel assembly complex subunit BamF n=1 Tax=Camelimonas abortus TaxID=1017184 RepID=A0ABV7LF89_9HYPH